jgi:hypothetical protein
MPGVLGVAPVCTTAFFAAQFGQRQKGTPSLVCSNVSMVARDPHFLQMNCWAIGTRKCYAPRANRQMTNSFRSRAG